MRSGCQVNRISGFFNAGLMMVVAGLALVWTLPLTGDPLEFIEPGRLYQSGVDVVEKYRRDMHDWEKSVRGFRRDHNFAMMAGPTGGVWHVTKLGGLAHQDVKSSGYFAQMQYSFHLPIYKGFGYTLGTSMSYITEQRVASELHPPSGGGFPGASIGLVLNVSPAFRLHGGFDYNLERWNELGERDGQDDDPTISVTARVGDWHAGFDVFYHLYWALRFEYHSRRSTYIRPFEVSASPALDAKIRKTDIWYGAGVVYHLL